MRATEGFNLYFGSLCRLGHSAGRKNYPLLESLGSPVAKNEGKHISNDCDPTKINKEYGPEGFMIE